jgi:serine/threonine protein kinase
MTDTLADAGYACPICNALKPRIYAPSIGLPYNILPQRGDEFPEGLIAFAMENFTVDLTRHPSPPNIAILVNAILNQPELFRTDNARIYCIFKFFEKCVLLAKVQPYELEKEEKHYRILDAGRYNNNLYVKTGRAVPMYPILNAKMGYLNAFVMFMPFAEGKPLNDFLVDRKESDESRLGLISSLILVADDMLVQGVIHGDFNPSNVFVRSDKTISFIDFEGRLGWKTGAPDIAFFLYYMPFYIDYFDKASNLISVYIMVLEALESQRYYANLSLETLSMQTLVFDQMNKIKDLVAILRGSTVTEPANYRSFDRLMTNKRGKYTDVMSLMNQIKEYALSMIFI